MPLDTSAFLGLAASWCAKYPGKCIRDKYPKDMDRDLLNREAGHRPAAFAITKRGGKCNVANHRRAGQAANVMPVTKVGGTDSSTTSQ